MNALSPRQRFVAPLLALLVTVPSFTGPRSWGQSSEEIDPTGGLRSRGMVPVTKPPATTREELIRTWDLDGNGTIDASEASIARARMRRARMQLELDSGLDPVTGKPRVTAETAAVDEEPAAEALDTLEAAIAPVESGNRPTKDSPIPGTRVPDPKPATSGTTVPEGQRAPPAASNSDPSASRQQQPATGRPGSIMGGVRAGAPAASAGYGSRGVKPDLNAGMPRTVRPGSPAARGGLLPSARPTPAPRATAPTGPTPRPAPVTADEIGGF
jgi:hypothetical protein